MFQSSMASSRQGFGAGQRGFKYPEQIFLLTHYGIRRSEFLFEGEAGLRLGKTQNALAAGELDEVKLDSIAVNHGFIVHEIRGIATGG